MQFEKWIVEPSSDYVEPSTYEVKSHWSETVCPLLTRKQWQLLTKVA